MALYNEIVAPLPCFGSVFFYSVLNAADVLIDVNEHYVKQTLRNRIQLVGANGPFMLTVPVKGQKGKKVAFKNILIDDTLDWRHQHKQAIQSNYASSPYFEHYIDKVMEVYEQNPSTLLDWNLAAHDAICDLLKWPEKKSDSGLQLSEKYIGTTPGRDIRKEFKSTTKEFEKYVQVFSDRHPFYSDLSILDLLFCEGPAAPQYLERQAI